MDLADINPSYILQQVGMLTCGGTGVILAVLRWRKGGVGSPRVQWCTMDMRQSIWNTGRSYGFHYGREDLAVESEASSSTAMPRIPKAKLSTTDGLRLGSYPIGWFGATCCDGNWDAENVGGCGEDYRGVVGRILVQMYVKPLRREASLRSPKRLVVLNMRVLLCHKTQCIFC